MAAHIRRAVLLDHAPPGLAVIANVSIDVTQENEEPPEGVLSRTPSVDSKKGGYAEAVSGSVRIHS